MNLRGGVIIVGSLLWDNAGRSDWRRTSLESLDTKIPLKLKIRYGRESGEKRRRTYTMIFSNDPTTDYGQGFAVGFQRRIRNEEALRNEALLLARAEGVWSTESPFLAKDWGAVGLLANDNAKNRATVLSAWQNVFRECRCNIGERRYDHEHYAFDSQAPVIDQAGLLQIEWLPEMDAFDFLLATPTAPKPRKPLTPDDIATRMIERNHRTYFEGNRASSITTFQDNQILELLTQQGSS
jgi:hypothetical protein